MSEVTQLRFPVVRAQAGIAELEYLQQNDE